MKLTLNHIIYICLITFLLLCISCKSDYSDKSERNPSQIEQDDNTKAQDEYIGVMNGYQPLSEAKLNEITTSACNFSDIEILYDIGENILPNGVAQTFKGLSISGGSLYSTRTYSSVETLKGEYAVEDAITGQNTMEIHTFTDAEVSAIYDYLSDYPAYFFNQEEFTGKTIPYLTSNSFLFENKYYRFSINIYGPHEDKPPDYWPVWTICKCVDEYPEQGTPLYGLFQIFENDFIDEFE